MAISIDKLFKGYTIKEIEEIMFKPVPEAKKPTKKQYSHLLKPSRRVEKRILVV